MDLELFLAHADDQRPVLAHGLPLDATFNAKSADFPELAPQRFSSLHPPDALPEQRWALIAPKGPLGDRLLELAAPLKRKREEEQGAEALVYRVDPGLDPAAAAAWIRGAYRDAVSRQEAALPRYLALLGGPDLLSWDFQQMLGGEAFVGRIAFDEEAAYEAYCDKAVRAAQANEAHRAKALFFAVQDGTRAMREGDRHLMRPCVDWARMEHTKGIFEADDIVDVPMDPAGSSLDPQSAAGALLRAAQKARAGMLFTMSHGAGRPARGWSSAAEQRAHQGSLVLGRAGDLLTARDIAEGPFLPFGVWFLFACFGAGTPSRSAYFPWLRELHALGAGSAAEHVLAALPRAGEPPFVAALPQAALANPEGPLGVIGHVDLAWSWSFLDYEMSGTAITVRNRAERFQGVLKALVHGHRFGVACDDIARFFRAANAELVAGYETRTQNQITSPAFAEANLEKVFRACLWMQRQDLSAYVLLGDPAARLPIAKGNAFVIGHTPSAAASLSAEEVTRREDAVLAVLRGTATVASTAARLGAPREEIERWMGIFLEAGRAALANNA